MLSRGVKDVVDRYINDLQAVYFRWSRDKPGGDGELLQLQVRPIQLWEIVFPEANAEQAMRLMCPRHGWDERCKSLAAIVRKTLKTAKMPEKYNFPKGTPRGIPSSKWVSVIPIGMKKDVYKKGIEQL